MTKLSDKIKTALDESRIMVLGIQILLAFEYRAIFESGFEALPRSSQYSTLACLIIMLAGTALIMWPSSYHRIVYEGNDAKEVHEFITAVMDVALLPVILALATDFYILGRKLWGFGGGMVAGTTMGLLGLFFLYGFGLLSRRLRRNRDKNRRAENRVDGSEESRGMRSTPINTKVEQVLTEARVVLPGATALLGFQLTTMLLEAFDKLPLSSKYVHMLSLVLMGISVILLMTPAAYHRIVERGEDTESFHRVASMLLIAAMVTLPIGLCGDLFVVVRKLTESTAASIATALLMLIFFYGLWFGFTAYRKHESQIKAN